MTIIPLVTILLLFRWMRESEWGTGLRFIGTSSTCMWIFLSNPFRVIWYQGRHVRAWHKRRDNILALDSEKRRLMCFAEQEGAIEKEIGHIAHKRKKQVVNRVVNQVHIHFTRRRRDDGLYSYYNFHIVHKTTLIPFSIQHMHYVSCTSKKKLC